MKKYLLVLSLIVFSFVAQANSIQATTGEKTFKTFNNILSSDVSSAEKILRVYMEDKMGCARVRLNLNIIKDDGVFSSGIFSLNLTSECNSNISDVRLDFDPLCSRDNDGEAALLIQYKNNGKMITKRFVVANSESCQE